MRRTKDEWIELVRSKPQDESVANYCKRTNIGVASYYKYLNKYKEGPLKLVPITIEENSNDFSFSFNCNGFNLKISDDVSVSDLQRILKATQ